MTPKDLPAEQAGPYSVLVVGSGAREHALVWAFSQSPSVKEIWAAPGNPGIAAMARLVDLPVSDVDGIADWAERNAIGLVVVGPEAPLAAGLVDKLIDRGVTVFGPTRAAAELEWSKSFAKSFMQRHDIPTARFGAYDDLDAALEFARSSAFPLVVKADGLAAGKGVIICQTADDAERAIRSMMLDRAFGAAGARVVIEEFLIGEELSVTALVDGERFVALPLARDYKRLADGDSGPNTGGMGSFSPVTDVAPDLLQIVRETILEPTVAGLHGEGRTFRGALYAGLKLTADGPRVLEFNCRLGDPETQVMLPLVADDLADVFLQCARGKLDRSAIAARPGAAVCIVMAAAGYPERPRAGDEIVGIDAAEKLGALVFHAGTAELDGQLVTNGGRVLSVVATGADSSDAVTRAYAAVERISFAGMQFRHDIASAAAARLA